MVRLAVIDKYNHVIGYLDNEPKYANHYYDELLHTYLEGSAALFEFTVQANPTTANLVQVGNKVSFIYQNKSYYFNIFQTEQTEREITATCYGSNFELLNELAPAHESTEGQSIEYYLNLFITSPGAIEIGLNEVSEKRIAAKWTSQDETLLARVFSLANIFEAEIELVSVLKDNYTLDKIVLNIYNKHSNHFQGLGQNRQDISLRYGNDIDNIKRTVDISELYSQILPVGKDDGGNPIFIHSVEIDEWIDGQHYVSKAGLDTMENKSAWERFPSSIKTGYILYRVDTEYKNVADLAGYALRKLQDISQPKVTYEVEGFYENLNIGDTVPLHDEAFDPPLHLKARVTEQEISWSNIDKCKTTFANYREL